MSKLQRGAICVLIAAAFSGGAVAAPCGEPSLSASAIVPGAPITLRAVMDEIANAAPQVRRAALETKARQAEVNQAGRRPNPVVGVELENFAGRQTQMRLWPLLNAAQYCARLSSKLPFYFTN